MPDGLFGRFRRKRQQTPPRPDSADEALERYFTDAEEASAIFGRLVDAGHLERRILVVFGAGAVGKSSLLKMYRLSCRRAGVPVALAAAEDAPSAVDLLARWSGDFHAGGLELAQVDDSLDRYRRLQAKVSAAASQAGILKPDLAGQATKIVAEGIVVGTAVVPGLGNVTAAIGPERIEALLTLIRQTLSRDDYEFFTDPTSRLNDDFLADVAAAAEERRVVLMLDTFEQARAQSAWLCNLAQRLPESLLFVVAGKEIPPWDRDWPGWAAYRTTVELRELSDDQIETLVGRYYTLLGQGEPDPDFVAEVVRFARGLPLAAATVVELVVSYGLADFHPTDGGVAEQLADKMLEDVPAELRPALEAAAILRSFNADALEALEVADASALYDQLRRLPFTRARREGFAVHETMREVIGAALAVRSPARFRHLNELAAAFYTGLLERAGGEERERVQRERLYHLIRTDEEAGIRAFRELAEGLARAQWRERLRALLNDVASFPLETTGGRLWTRYYNARLAQLDGHLADAEAELAAVGADAEAEPTLRAYAFCDLGAILATLDRLAAPGGEQAALAAVEQSLALRPDLDSKLVENHYTRMKVSNARADWEESVRHVEAAREAARAADDTYALVTADRLKAGLYGLQGDWHGYLEMRRKYLELLSGLGDVPALRMNVAYFTWPLTFMGRYAAALVSAQEALQLALRLEERELMITIRESIGLTLGLQGAFAEAAAQFQEAYDFYERFHRPDTVSSRERYIRGLLGFRGLVALREGRLDDAEEDLARALEVKTEIGDRIGLPEVHVWRGQLHELRSASEDAERAYDDAVGLRDVGRNYFHCAALAGLARVRAARRPAGDVNAPLAEATELAERFEYNDLLAALHLVQGHLALETGTAAGADKATDHYRQALIFALRFNRYLLDEILVGRPEGSPHRAVIPTLAAGGERGAHVLTQLSEWWATGTNDGEAGAIGVSPLELGSPLVEAERDARAREGGGAPAAATVVENLASALKVD
jgi:hypothetical protein